MEKNWGDTPSATLNMDCCSIDNRNLTPTLIFSTYALYIQKTLSPERDHFVIFH